jgi:predicted deacylase
VDYGALLADLRRWSTQAKISTYGTVRENGRPYPLLKLETPGRPRVLITAGFHGEEPAGPLTLARHFGAIARYARSRGVGLTVFPCINPSGFEAGTRYNASGERPNNDFLRYRLPGGKVVGELYGTDTDLPWRLFRKGPKETRAVRRALEKLPTPLAALDLHQDDHMLRPAAYTYVFGEARWYAPLARRSAKSLPLAASCEVDPGLRSDENGFIWFHDGSVTDWMMRRGARYCATVETTTQSPARACDAVNLVWVRGFIDLAARGPK